MINVTELDLYKFISNNNCEARWHGDELIVFIEYCDLHELSELLGYAALSDGGIDSTIVYGHVCFDLAEVCEWFDIDPERIVEKDDPADGEEG